MALKSESRALGLKTLAVHRRPGGDYIAAISLGRVREQLLRKVRSVLIRGMKIDFLVTKGKKWIKIVAAMTCHVILLQ